MKKIKIVRAVQTSIACPCQWDAWDEEGNYYYLRFRHGHGSVEQYENEDWVNAEPGQWHRTISYFNNHDDPIINLKEFAEEAGIELAPNLIQTGFGDHIADKLVTEHGVPLHQALDVTEPWRKLSEGTASGGEAPSE